MTRSFRFKLALRATLWVVAGIGALALATIFALKTLLDRGTDAAILRLASTSTSAS